MHNSPNSSEPLGHKASGGVLLGLSGLQDRTCPGTSSRRLCYVHELVCPAEGGCYLWAVLLSVGVCFVRRGVWLGGKTCRDRGFPAELSTGTQWWLLFTSPVNDFIIVADWALIIVLYMLHRLFPLNEPLRHQEERWIDTFWSHIENDCVTAGLRI